MAQDASGQSSFIGGILSPFNWANTKSEIYKAGLKTATNVIVRPTGPVEQRPGTTFLDFTKNTFDVKFIEFQPTLSEGYVLEFGVGYIRIWKDGVLIESGGNPVELITSILASDLPNLQVAQLERDLYVVDGRNIPQIINVTLAGVWTIRNLSMTVEPSLEIGYLPNVTLTPGAISGSSVTFTAGGSVFLASFVGRRIKHKDSTGDAVITAIAGSTCTVDILTNFASTSAISAGEWIIEGSPLTTLTASGKDLGSKITLTLGSAGWTSGDVGSYVFVSGGICKITAFSSSTVVSAIVLKKLNSTSTTRVWRLEQLEWNSTRGYPSSVCVFEQRLWFGRKITIWGSAIGLYDDYGVLPTENSSVVFNLAQTQTANIVWLMGASNLIIGTDTGISSVGQPQGMITGFTPGKLSQQTSFGSCIHRPVRGGENIYCISKDKKRIYALRQAVLDGTRYAVGDVLLNAEHLTANTTIKEISYSSSPFGRLIAVLEDGTILHGTVIDEDKLFIAWTKWETLNGQYQTLSVVGATNNVDKIYTAVERTYFGDALISPSGVPLLSPSGVPLVTSGSPNKAVELFDGERLNTAFKVITDCSTVRNERKDINSITQDTPCKVYVTAHGYSTGNKVMLTTLSGTSEISPTEYTITVVDANSFTLNSTTNVSVIPSTYCRLKTNTITGLERFDGVSLKVKADGVELEDKTVSSGTLTLHASTVYATAVAGLKVTATVETLRKDLLSQSGNTYVGRPTRMADVLLYVSESTMPKVGGYTTTTLTTANVDIYNSLLYNEILRYGNQPWTKDFTLTVTNESTLPMTILGIFGQSEGNLS